MRRDHAQAERDHPDGNSAGAEQALGFRLMANTLEELLPERIAGGAIRIAKFDPAEAFADDLERESMGMGRDPAGSRAGRE